MTDTVTRLMAKVHAIENLAALAADPMNSEQEQTEYVNELVETRQSLQDELAQLRIYKQCVACNGSGRMVRDPDIGTDQECFVCGGSGIGGES